MENIEQSLISDKWVSQKQLEAAKQEAEKIKKPLPAALVKLGFLSLEDLAIFFAQEGNIPYVKISDYILTPEIMRLIDETFCREHLVVPLFKIKDILYIACANPLDSSLLDTLSYLSKTTLELLLASSVSIHKALNSFYGPQDKVFELEELIIKQDSLKGLSFWRESPRIHISLPVSLTIEGNEVTLPYSAAINGTTRDISDNGTSIGLEVFLYLPKGLCIWLEFHPECSLTAIGRSIRAKGEIVYCRMEKGQHYFLGIKFSEITAEARDELFKLTTARKTDPLADFT